MTTTAVQETAVERLLGELERRPEPAGGPERLRGLRRDAAARFAELGFPTVRQEGWRSTNVAPIARTPWRSAPAPGPIARRELEPWLYEGLPRVVLVNGRLAPELSDLGALPAGVVVSGLAAARESHPEILEEHLGRYADFDKHAFVALNTAFLDDGVLVWVPKGVAVEEPLNLLLVGHPGPEPLASFPRILVVAEESSQLTLVEQYVTVGSGVYFTSPVTEFRVGANAAIDHYKLEREALDAFHVATQQVALDRDSRFSSHSISWGGGLVRNDVNAILDGEGCEATLNGLYMVDGTQLVDNHMRVEHAKPHCDSHELYKGILEGSSRAVFNGRIYVHEGAQKTDAKQTNRNLLLSPEAMCHSNPELEIFADDVKCTHGSTVGQLDDLAVFYLRSRGIGEEAAKSLLTYAFAADVVGRIRVEPVRRDLEEFLFRRLPEGDIVRQAV